MIFKNYQNFFPFFNYIIFFDMDVSIQEVLFLLLLKRKFYFYVSKVKSSLEMELLALFYNASGDIFLHIRR